VLRAAKQERSRRTPAPQTHFPASQGILPVVLGALLCELCVLRSLLAFVILSVVSASRSEAGTQSKDLFSLFCHPERVSASRSEAGTQSKDPSTSNPFPSLSGNSPRSPRRASPRTLRLTISFRFPCHPERSECFAQRSRNAVEGPQHLKPFSRPLWEFSPWPSALLHELCALRSLFAFHVILSVVSALRSEAGTQSKDPGTSNPFPSLSGNSPHGPLCASLRTPRFKISFRFFCHPERSECFAQRSKNAVEGPQRLKAFFWPLREFSPWSSVRFSMNFAL
jgi:hypothetical protein